MKLSFKKILSLMLALILAVTAVQLEQLSIVKAEDTARTTFSAADADCLEYVLLNRYSDNGSEFGGSNFGDLRWDYPSLYKLQTRTGLNGLSTLADNSTTDYRWPYMAIKVNAEKTGTYNLTVKVSGNSSSTYDTFGMLVDGVVHVLKWKKSTSAHDVNTTVNLTEGTHIITFTSAMPEHPEDAAGKANDTNAYPWFNYYGVTVDAGLTIEKAPTKAEVVASMATRIEAEDTTHVTYDALGASGYGDAEDDFESNTNASGGKVVGGVSNSVIAQTEASLKKYLDKKTTPYVQYTVEAPKDGVYNIRVGYLANKASANTATDLPYCMVLVNDNVYKAQCNNEWGALDAINLAVELKAGRNIIRCTSFTNDQASIYNAGGWACINHDYLDIQSGLTVVDNGAAIPSTVAGDSTVVLGNNYTANGDNLESAVQESMRSNLPSIETLAQKAFLNLSNWPFAAIKVTTTTAGYYDITTGSGLKGVDDQIYLGVIVNGNAYGKYVAKSTSKIDSSVYLEAGENIIVFTAPMPLDDATAKTVNIYNGYPWFNFLNFTLDDGMELSTTAPTLDEVIKSMGNRIEAEDTNYVSYDYKKGYSNKTASDTEIYYSDLGYAGGVSKGNITYTYDEIAEYTDINKYAPYVQYAVNVSEAGDYVIRLGSYVGCSTKPYVAVQVNGQTYKAQFSNTWAMSMAGLTVSLKEGINYIRVSGVTKEFVDKVGTASCWLNHDYIDVEKNVTPVSNADLPGVANVNAWDTTNVLTKNFNTITEGTEVGGANTNGMKNNRVSLETALNYLDVLTYTALKVNAESDGYYDVHVTVSSKTGDAVSKNLAMIIDGRKLYKIDAALSGSKHTIGATIHLSKGVHTIMVTTPMPDTDVDAQAVPDGSTDNWAGMTNAYPWFNFYTYSLSDGLTPAGAPTENEMIKEFTDISMDGFVNETDTATLRKYLVGISVEINKQAADCNEDTCIDIKDIISFKKQLAKIAEYPTAYLSDSDENFAMQDENYVTIYAKSALDNSEGTVINIGADTTRTIEGFGASFTDTSAYVMSEMSEEQQEKAMTKLFDKQDGIGLSMIRNSVGSSDFSSEYYTYQDDSTKEFALAGGQTENILKYTQKAMEYNKDLKVFLTPWTAPLWMKSSQEWNSDSGASLKSEYYDEYATYLTNAVKAYEKNGVPIYAITPQNEPWTSNPWPGMCWEYTDLITFTNNNLKPTLTAAGLSTKILNLDYNFQNWEKGSLIMAATRNNTDGIAFHGYSGEPEEMENVTKVYSDKLCYVTENSESYPSDLSSLLRITNKIARSLRSGANGFMNWNIALESEGGPTLNNVNEHCSPLISYDKETGEVTYTRDFYSLAHFSKFMKQDAVRVESDDTGAATDYKLVNVVTKNTDGTMTAVLVNSYTAESKVCKLVYGDKVIEITLAPRSTVTLTWHPDFEI